MGFYAAYICVKLRNEVPVSYGVFSEQSPTTVDLATRYVVVHTVLRSTYHDASAHARVLLAKPDRFTTFDLDRLACFSNRTIAEINALPTE